MTRNTKELLLYGTAAAVVAWLLYNASQSVKLAAAAMAPPVEPPT